MKMRPEQVKHFLESTVDASRRFKHPCLLYEFVLKHGVYFRNIRWRKLSPEIARHRGLPKECFKNAGMAAVTDKSLTYCEGFAASLIPVLHAWCVTKKGQVIELTWERPSMEYFGIAFKREFVRDRLLSDKYFGLLDQWWGGYPLLRGQFPADQWKENVDKFVTTTVT